MAFSQSLENLFELLSLGRIDDIVCVEPKGIIPRGPRQCGIACGGEIIDPYKIKDACPKRPGDLGRAVGAAGIDDNDLIEHPAHGLETGGKVFSSSLTIMVRLTLALRSVAPASLIPTGGDLSTDFRIYADKKSATRPGERFANWNEN